MDYLKTPLTGQQLPEKTISAKNMVIFAAVSY